MTHTCGRSHTGAWRHLRTERENAAAPARPDQAASVAEDAPAKHEQIAVLAYSYWESRGCPAGSPDVDWFRAERELQGRSEI